MELGLIKKVGVIAGVVLTVGIGFLLMPSKGSYSDCILEYMPQAQTKAAAILMKKACREQYPEEMDFTGAVNPFALEKQNVKAASGAKLDRDLSGIDFTGVDEALNSKATPGLPPGFVLDKKPKLKKVKCDPFKEALKGASAEGEGSRGELPACEGN